MYNERVQMMFVEGECLPLICEDQAHTQMDQSEVLEKRRYASDCFVFRVRHARKYCTPTNYNIFIL